MTDRVRTSINKVSVTLGLIIKAVQELHALILPLLGSTEPTLEEEAPNA